MKQSLIVLTILALPNWVLAETANPASENLSDTNIPLRAQIKAKDSTQISSEMSARIHQLKWRDGDHFNEGDTLVSFHCSLEEAQLNKAKATLEKAAKTYEVKQRLEELQPLAVFQQCYRAKYDADAPDELTALFNELLEGIH